MLKLNGKPPPNLQNTDPNYKSKQPGVPRPKRAAEHLQPLAASQNTAVVEGKESGGAAPR